MRGRAVPLLLLLTVVTLSGTLGGSGVFSQGGSAHAQIPRGISVRPDLGPVTAVATAQLSATATQEQTRTITFSQNGSGIYAGSSQVATFPTNFTAYTPTSVSSYLATFFESATGGRYPQTNLTQGTSVLANATAALPYTISPSFSATAVKERVVELFTAAGGLPSPGTYSVLTDEQQAIYFTETSVLNWSANVSSEFSASYSVTPPAGYWFNQSQVYLPFPATTTGVNWSTVLVLLNGTTYTDFQVVTGGVYVSLAPLAPLATDALTLRFQVLPAISGPAPVLSVTYDAVYNATYFQLNTSWANVANVAYAGAFLLQLRLAYPVSPAGLVVEAGLRTLPNGSYFLAGNTLEILPLIVTVASGGAIAFTVFFQFYGAPPTETISASTVAFSAGSTVVTWGQVTGGLATLFLVGLSVTVMFAGPPRGGGAAGRRYRLRGESLRRVEAGLLAGFVVFAGLLILLELL